jgi:hypothetical protein
MGPTKPKVASATIGDSFILLAAEAVSPDSQNFFDHKGSMFRSFKTLNNDPEIEASSTSQAQLPPRNAIENEVDGVGTLLDSLAVLSKNTGMSVIQHGARISVIGELLVSVLTHLPSAMQADIAQEFRGRIEELLSLTDDRSLPGQYQQALLIEVNRYLNALR